MSHDGIVRPARGGANLDPKNEMNVSLATDRPRIGVKDRYLAEVEGKADVESEIVVDLRDFPTDFFHPGGKVPETFTANLRKKQIARVCRGDAAYLGGPALRDVAKELKKAAEAAKEAAKARKVAEAKAKADAEKTKS